MVTHARASADYAYNFIQWQIGFSSMLAEALGLAPLKDTFHSITIQTENDADGDVPGDLFNWGFLTDTKEGHFYSIIQLQLNIV